MKSLFFDGLHILFDVRVLWEQGGEEREVCSDLRRVCFCSFTEFKGGAECTVFMLWNEAKPNVLH